MKIAVRTSSISFCVRGKPGETDLGTYSTGIGAVVLNNPRRMRLLSVEDLMVGIEVVVLTGSGSLSGRFVVNDSV